MFAPLIYPKTSGANYIKNLRNIINIYHWTICSITHYQYNIPAFAGGTLSIHTISIRWMADFLDIFPVWFNSSLDKNRNERSNIYNFSMFKKRSLKQKILYIPCSMFTNWSDTAENRSRVSGAENAKIASGNCSFFIIRLSSYYVFANDVLRIWKTKLVAWYWIY